MKTTLKRSMLAFFVGVIAIGNAYAAEVPAPSDVPAQNAPVFRRAPVLQDERELYFSAADYSWREILQNGRRAMSESGPLFGLGFAYRHEFEDRINMRLGIELFGGTVDYDGATQAGIPVKTTDTYYGFKLRGDVGQAFAVGEKGTVLPFVGLGFWNWTRTTKDATTAAGTPAYGYSEDWLTLFVRLGLYGTMSLSDGAGLFGEAGLKLPLYNENYAHIGSGVTVNPGKEVSYFAEVGVKREPFKVSVFYEGLRFSASDPDPVTGLYQPESIADIVGLKVGWLF